jgi:hypothetical protein
MSGIETIPLNVKILALLVDGLQFLWIFLKIKGKIRTATY